ncbi:uncharacterized protein MYCFIDRAFT_177487 [Pseudocercospora fijiensis CIRAD86]|uniref:Uncharacterized protein n=1 Tax=Pseudocercospora fijiensis (strain CIRAD86) TaxID=383855 RepID=M2YS22_PSEFD|nr:uncharacterized protein MYCFIDRAFT_177487 [Pseudocercospora fijiensis CIRAD86]EME80545.1 hypothetical protein MYCFIDRAFT_177487 [Pseudocercospora fijiensis CIRAD86]
MDTVLYSAFDVGTAPNKTRNLIEVCITCTSRASTEQAHVTPDKINEHLDQCLHLLSIFQELSSFKNHHTPTSESHTVLGLRTRSPAYTMQIRTLIFSILVYSAGFANALLRIGDVFDIQPGYIVNGGCNAYYYPNDPNTHLNKWWWQILSMHAQAVVALDTPSYEGSSRTRKLLLALLGIAPRVDSQGWDRVPYSNSIDGFRLREVRKNMRIFWDFVNTPGNANYKAKLFCGGGYWYQQFEDSPLLDAMGNKVLRDSHDPSRGFVTLGEHERMHGRGQNFGTFQVWSVCERVLTTADRYWYFHSTVHTEYPTPEGGTKDSKYWLEDRDASPETRNARSPWPVDEGTGSTHPCMKKTLVARVFDDSFANPGLVYPARSHGHIILCGGNPQLIPNSVDELDLRPQHVGKRLQQMRPNCLIPYHEIVHLALGGQNSPDAERRRPIIDQNGFVHPQWPWNVRAWYATGKNGIGANDMLNVALFDRATDDHGSPGAKGSNRFPWLSWDDLDAIKNPESLVWWSYANYLLVKTGDDWSVGVIEDPLVQPPLLGGKMSVHEPPDTASINETTLEMVQNRVNVTEILERWKLEEEQNGADALKSQLKVFRAYCIHFRRACEHSSSMPKYHKTDTKGPPFNSKIQSIVKSEAMRQQHRETILTSKSALSASPQTPQQPSRPSLPSNTILLEDILNLVRTGLADLRGEKQETPKPKQDTMDYYTTTQDTNANDDLDFFDSAWLPSEQQTTTTSSIQNPPPPPPPGLPIPTMPPPGLMLQTNLLTAITHFRRTSEYYAARQIRDLGYSMLGQEVFDHALDAAGMGTLPRRWRMVCLGGEGEVRAVKGVVEGLFGEGILRGEEGKWRGGVKVGEGPAEVQWQWQLSQEDWEYRCWHRTGYE